MRIKIIVLSLLLSSCTSFYIPLLTPYKMDIRQGNFVTPEMRANLKIGMTKPQVLFVMGTPLIQDVFQQNRWDYVYRYEHARKIVDKQRMTLYFEGDKLVRIVDDSAPAVAAPAKSDGQAKG
ncbi:MAG TPA: outer membrane protein assembly factor BamE [Gallionella sp.]|nr:outer membrane protein assembly factor BamE [Gallionella sp.]